MKQLYDTKTLSSNKQTKWKKCLTITNKFLIVFCACLGSSFAAQTTEESKILLDDLIQQVKTTMTAVASAERKAGNSLNDLNLTLNIPASVSPNLGLVLDVNNPAGFKVLSVSPGSVADKLSISPNSIITSINGKKTGANDGKGAFSELENALPGDIVEIRLLKDGQSETLNASVDGQFTPAVQIKILGEDLEGSVTKTSVDNNEQANNACGVVSVFNKPPVTRDLHPTIVTQIDEEGVNRNRVNFILPIGKHTIHVQEFISDSMFRRRSFNLQDAKTIEIDVQPNTTYHLAAKFNREFRNEQKNGKYWDPVVWKTQNKNCEL